jgi:hypothetical protein
MGLRIAGSFDGAGRNQWRVSAALSAISNQYTSAA